MRKSDYLDYVTARAVNIKNFFSKNGQLSKWEKELLKDNRDLKNCIKNKRCFILGNGPSLKEQKLEELKDEFVFTVNKAVLINEFSNINTNVHLWSDEDFFKEEKAGKGIVDLMKSVKTSDNNPICFFPTHAQTFVKKYGLDNELNIKYFKSTHLFYKNYKKTINFCGGVPAFNTVVLGAVILAIYMGASEIYLLGCDCTGIIPYIESKQGQVKNGYSYNITEEDSIRVKKMMQKYSNADFFMGNARIFKQYEMIHEYCSRNNVKIFNATGGGILEEIPRVDFDKIISNK